MNITYSGTKMTIVVDLDMKPRNSSTGKSRIVYTTSGSPTVSTPFGNCSVGINIFTKDENWGKSVAGSTAPQPVAKVVRA